MLNPLGVNGVPFLNFVIRNVNSYIQYMNGVYTDHEEFSVTSDSLLRLASR